MRINDTFVFKQTGIAIHCNRNSIAQDVNKCQFVCMNLNRSESILLEMVKNKMRVCVCRGKHTYRDLALFEYD